MAHRSGFRTSSVAAMLVSAGLATQMPLARSEVMARSSGGFQLKSSAWVSGSPKNAYERAVGDVARWWDPSHTYSGRAANLTLEARAGGCFCESLEGGGGVQHLGVGYVQPGAAIRLLGGLGPLQELGASGALTWKFEAVENRTRVTWTYRVTGMEAGDVDKLAGLVDQVLIIQLNRLARFIDSGAP